MLHFHSIILNHLFATHSEANACLEKGTFECLRLELFCKQQYI